MTWIYAALGVAVIDWLSVRTGREEIETIAKPLVMVLLIIGALTADAGSERLLIAAGLAFGLVGDVALLPRFDRFMQGLGAFLVGHVLYVAAFIVAGISFLGTLGGLAVAVVSVVVVGASIANAAPAKLQPAVAQYILVISAMVATGIGTGVLLFGLGALIFAVSDGLLGHDRFVDPRDDRRMFVHMLYHAGQALLVGALY